jgi:hypothetical protein
VKQAGIFGSYHFAERRIRSNELEDVEIPRGATPIEQVNRNKAGIFGARLNPVAPLRILFSAEVGRNDRPFYPTSDKNYEAYTARASWRQKRFNLSTDFKSFNNANSTSLYVHSSTGRTWGATTGFTPRANIQIDAGYDYLHLDTLTGLAYFANFELVASSKSYYVTNVHTLHAGVQAQIRKKVDLYAGFVRTQDRGDGRAASPQDIFAAAQVFPLSYASPLARVSFQLRANLRANFGWQYYDYAEKFARLQDYSAHTGYVSLSYSF